MSGFLAGLAGDAGAIDEHINRIIANLFCCRSMLVDRTSIAKMSILSFSFFS